MDQIKPTPSNVMRILTTAINPDVEYKADYIDGNPHEAAKAVFQEYSDCIDNIEKEELACKLDDIVGRMESWTREIAHAEGIRFGMAIMMNFFME